METRELSMPLDEVRDFVQRSVGRLMRDESCLWVRQVDFVRAIDGRARVTVTCDRLPPDYLNRLPRGAYQYTEWDWGQADGTS